MRWTLQACQDGAGDSDPTMNDNLQQLGSQLDGLGASVRRIVHRMRPIALAELGLVGALEWLMESAIENTDLEAHVDIDPTLDEVPDDLSLMLFRAAQECVNNTLKHAQAKNAWLSLTFEDGRYQLSFRDDGIGMDPRTARSEGLGLAGIETRAKSAKGEVSFGASPEGGFQMELSVPSAPRSGETSL